MTAQNKVRLVVGGIVVLTALAVLFSYPKGPDIRIGSFEREVKVHLGLDLQGGTSLLYKADVSEVAEEERGNALDGVRDVIEQRINAFGVGEPNIQTVRSGDEWRVLVELPGVTDISEAIDRIGETPLLEFKVLGEAPPLTEEQIALIQEANANAKQQAEDVLARAVAGEDFNALAEEFSQDTSNAALGGSLGEFGRGIMVAEFEQAAFEDAPVGEVYNQLVETEFGWHIIRVDERTLVDEEVEGEEDQDRVTASHILIAKTPEDSSAFGPVLTDTGLTGEQLERADVVFEPNTGLPAVSLTFNSEGRDLFSDLTQEHLNEQIYILLDGNVISAPEVQQRIDTGEAQITGTFAIEEAKELALRLNAGALPVPVELIGQQNVGPTLGQRSIETSFFAGVVGLILLSIFMIAYYRLPGVMAVFALGIYTLLVLVVFKLWPVTLTLAGIAGFVLSIGMAVDANVLIFERLKEELRKGKPVMQSIRDGFDRAWPSIRDSNASSLITCLILYWFGSSLIRGFAITLAIGILVSMFSAITITRHFLLVSRVNNTRWYGVKRNKA